MSPTETKEFHLHLVSDATGETINSVARACVAQFEHVMPIEHFWNMVRSPRQLEMVLEGIRHNPGVVMFTLVDDTLRRALVQGCHAMNIPCIPVLDPLITALGNYLGIESKSQPGRQHIMDAEYFERIEAMDFVLAHDDGQNTDDLDNADVVILGVSRTSKTPTCIYLGNRGIKAANIPLVPEIPVPDTLGQLSNVLIVGLTTDPAHLIQIRRQRLNQIQGGAETTYVDPEKVEEEVRNARNLYQRNRWPIINVGRRSIEETAAEIIAILARHKKDLLEKNND